MGKILGKLKDNYNAFPEFQTKLFQKQWHGIVGHFQKVSMNSITNCTFSKFQVQFYGN